MSPPVWYSQLVWSDPIDVRSLTINPDLMMELPPGSGLYMYLEDLNQPSRGNVLYIGKADGAEQSIRSRIGAYLRRFRAGPGGKPAKHRGMEMLANHYHRVLQGPFLRVTGVIIARELEGQLIDMFNPRFNNKDEHHSFPYDERIPDEMLYTWP